MGPGGRGFVRNRAKGYFRLEIADEAGWVDSSPDSNNNIWMNFFFNLKSIIKINDNKDLLDQNFEEESETFSLLSLTS